MNKNLSLVSFLISQDYELAITENRAISIHHWSWERSTPVVSTFTFNEEYSTNEIWKDNLTHSFLVQQTKAKQILTWIL